MKNIIIEVPRTGAAVEFILRAGVPSGQVVIVASDDVEIRLKEVVPAAAPRAKSLPTTNNANTPTPKPTSHNLDTILQRLLKLKPTKRVTAVNSIKAMFQFDAPISDGTANKILEDLRSRGSLKIDANDKIQFRSA